jgi:hypothetical protein
METNISARVALAGKVFHHERMNATPSRSLGAPLIAAFVIIALPPALYVLGYWWLAEYGYLQSGVRVASYRWGGVAAERIFWPLEYVDRRLHPDRWQPICVIPAEPSQ